MVINLFKQDSMSTIHPLIYLKYLLPVFSHSDFLQFLSLMFLSFLFFHSGSDANSFFINSYCFINCYSLNLLVAIQTLYEILASVVIQTILFSSILFS